KLYTKEKGGWGKHVRLKLAAKEQGGAEVSRSPVYSYREQPSGRKLNAPAFEPWNPVDRVSAYRSETLKQQSSNIGKENCNEAVSHPRPGGGPLPRRGRRFVCRPEGKDRSQDRHRIGHAVRVRPLQHQDVGQGSQGERHEVHRLRREADPGQEAREEH